MPNQFFARKKCKARRGATIALVMIFLPVLFLLAAFAINLVYMQTVNTEVQIAADAAVRSATRTYVLSGSKDQALLAAQEAAAMNPINGNVLPINAVDLEYGVSQRYSLGDPYVFVPASVGNSVRLTTQSLAAGNGPTIEPLFPLFGSLVNIRPLRTATSTKMTVDIVLVVDRSGSMAYSATEIGDGSAPPAAAPAGWWFDGPVPPQSRWLDLVAAVNAFNTALSTSPDHEQLALATYNEVPVINVPLTTNYTQVADALDAISLNFIMGATNIGDGMNAGLVALKDPTYSRQFASKVMIVMTDGNHNTGWWPDSAATVIAAEGVTIYTVTFSDEANQALMQLVASRGSGEHFHATTSAQLTSAFQQIARRLPTILTN